MRSWTLAIAAAVASCVTTSSVVPLADGQFMVTGHASGGLNAGKGTAAAAEQASSFCAHRSQQMQVVSTDFHGMAAVGGESSTFVFRCVNAS